MQRHAEPQEVEVLGMLQHAPPPPLLVAVEHPKNVFTQNRNKVEKHAKSGKLETLITINGRGLP